MLLICTTKVAQIASPIQRRSCHMGAHAYSIHLREALQMEYSTSNQKHRKRADSFRCAQTFIYLCVCFRYNVIAEKVLYSQAYISFVSKGETGFMISRLSVGGNILSMRIKICGHIASLSLFFFTFTLNFQCSLPGARRKHHCYGNEEVGGFPALTMCSEQVWLVQDNNVATMKPKKA